MYFTLLLELPPKKVLKEDISNFLSFFPTSLNGKIAMIDLGSVLLSTAFVMNSIFESFFSFTLEQQPSTVNFVFTFPIPKIYAEALAFVLV